LDHKTVAAIKSLLPWLLLLGAILVCGLIVMAVELLRVIRGE
jgi:hypothetical protein